MMEFRPAIRRNGILLELPRPVTQLRLGDVWDYEKFKVPTADGDFYVGHSRNGVDVHIEGQIGAVAGALAISEASMLAVIDGLRAALDVQGTDDRFELVLFQDPAAGLERRLEACTTLRAEYDLSDKVLFTYSVVVHASDPTLHSAPMS